MTPIRYFENFELVNLTEMHEDILYIEEWRPIIGLEDYYQISSFGRIKSLPRKRKMYTPQGYGAEFYDKEKIIKQEVTPKGYLRIVLQAKRKRIKRFAHVIVAKHFILNPNDLPEVNHLKGFKYDNRYWMLEWSTKSDNQLHAIRTGLKKIKYGEETHMYGKKGALHHNSKPVIQYTLNGEMIKRFESICEAKRETGLPTSNIQKVCVGARNHCGGYNWKYAI